METLYAYLAGIIDIDGYISSPAEFTGWHWWEAEHQKARTPLPIQQQRLAAKPVK